MTLSLADQWAEISNEALFVLGLLQGTCWTTRLH